MPQRGKTEMVVSRQRSMTGEKTPRPTSITPGEAKGTSIRDVKGTNEGGVKEERGDENIAPNLDWVRNEPAIHIT